MWVKRTTIRKVLFRQQRNPLKQKEGRWPRERKAEDKRSGVGR